MDKLVTSPQAPSPVNPPPESTGSVDGGLKSGWGGRAPLWIGGFVLSLLVFLAFGLQRGGNPSAVGFGIRTVAILAGSGLGLFACTQAVRREKVWEFRVRLAWILIAISAGFFCAGTFASLIIGLHAQAAGRVPEPPTLVDLFLIIQQPLLWVGLLLLAWRGHSLGIMRLLFDSLIVVLAAMVLSWSVLLEKRFLDPDMSAAAKAIAIYYPLCDIAHLFCVLMLMANVRERPSLARASGWLLSGVLCLIVTDSVNSYFGQSRLLQQISPWMDVGPLWSYLLIGMAALIHSDALFPEPTTRRSGVDDAIEVAPVSPSSSREGSKKLSDWDQKLVRWHHSAMLWLPYIATLGVSAVLISQEMRKSVDSLQRLLPVVSLLLAIVARQMLTLWDNLQLSERLRASNADLERNVDERTRHLATLHGITSTLNTSLDRRTVLRVTLEKTIAAVHGDGGGIWLRQAPERDAPYGAPDEWSLVHWQGLDGDPNMPSMLRDLAIAAAEERGDGQIHLTQLTREALQNGTAPPSQRLILVPVRWQGQLLGVMGLVRVHGQFSYEDRALVESVALEAGTALQNARLYSEASRRADRDSVTDLLNHRAAQEQLNATLARSKRTRSEFAIVMMDLNNFKFFNDTYGHPVGDEVLRTVARGLKESCRTSDILGRYGGDEFIVVLPDTDAAGTIEVCQRIAAGLDARHFEPVPGTKLPISFSFGWAVYPQDGENSLELLTQADANLYNHKRGGASYLTQRARAAKEGNDEIKKLKNRVWGGSFGVLDALVTAIDNKDHYTRHHSEEVTYLSLLVAKEMDFSPEALRAVRISGLLHDVGKIAVPDHILRHPGKLGREEWDIMQQHPVFGALIVKDVPNLEEVLGGIRNHHEKWDGSGYPDKFSGTDIPLLGRLLALADVYSALTTDRPYRKGWNPDAALEEIERCSGSHFDPHLCGVFLKVMRREIALLGDGNSADYSLRIAESFGDTPVDSGVPAAAAPEPAPAPEPEPVKAEENGSAHPVNGLAEGVVNAPGRMA